MSAPALVAIHGDSMGGSPVNARARAVMQAKSVLLGPFNQLGVRPGEPRLREELVSAAASAAESESVAKEAK